MNGFAAFVSCTLAAMAGVCFVGGLAVLKGKGEGLCLNSSTIF